MPAQVIAASPAWWNANDTPSHQLALRDLAAYLHWPGTTGGTNMKAIARLAERGCIGVDGPEAEKFLQGLVTNDMGDLASQPAIHAGLLSPQGKLLFEFIVVRRDAGFDLETAKARIPDLIKRLKLYTLRARVEIADKSAHTEVYALWGQETRDQLPAREYPDPRLAALGKRALAPAGTPIAVTHAENAYHAHRIALGVPQDGCDYSLGEIFPHEAGYDLLSGVSFDKGCFVGQEVVSRMQHRGTARRRFVIVSGSAQLPAAGQPITAGSAGGTTIGHMGSSQGDHGLALVRLDRAGEALAAGEPLLAGPVPVRLEVPPWAPYRFAVPDPGKGAE